MASYYSPVVVWMGTSQHRVFAETQKVHLRVELISGMFGPLTAESSKSELVRCLRGAAETGKRKMVTPIA